MLADYFGTQQAILQVRRPGIQSKKCLLRSHDTILTNGLIGHNQGVAHSTVARHVEMVYRVGVTTHESVLSHDTYASQ